jgi:hypothetical protein
MKKRYPFCSEEILIEAIKCKHCGEFLENEVKRERGIEFLDKKNNRNLLKIIIAIVVIIFIYKFYNASRARVEYNRSFIESYEKSDNYRLPSGKIIDLARVPLEDKHEVKTYLSYKDKRDSWRNKAYEDGYGSDAEYQVGIFDGIIEEYEIEHPRVSENSYKVKTVRE